MATPVSSDRNSLSPAQPMSVTRIGRMRGIRLVFITNAINAVYANITTGAVVTGYALHLGATNYHIGLLSSAPTFVQGLQAVFPVITERFKHRKPVHCTCNLISYLLWIPIAFIPLYVREPFRPWVMIGLTALAGVAVGFGSPAGVSWITDLIPPEMMGWFYARQNTILTIVGMTTALAAGGYIDLTPPHFGFPSVFLAAVVAAVISNIVLRFVPEPEKKTADSRTLAETFALPFLNRNFRNLMIFFALSSMAIMVAAPFFSVYWIKHLKMSYSYIAVISALMSLSMVASYQVWGYLSDKYGNKPVTKICWSGMCFIPITWFFVTKDNYPIGAPMAALYGGFFGGGVLLSQLNLRAKMAPEENRSVYIGCFNGVVSAASAIGPIIGGSLAAVLKDVDFHILWIHVETLKCLFLISAALRICCSPLLWLVKEGEEIPAQFLLRQMPARNPIASVLNLVRFSRTPRTGTRMDAARALGSTRTRLAVEELIAALNDSSWEVRREAARSLGEIGDTRAVEPLIAKLTDREADIVEDAAEALGKLNDPSALAPLTMLLDSDHPSVRRSAVSALGNLGNVNATHYLEKLLERENDPLVYRATLDALSRIGGGSAIHYLRNLLRKSGPGITRRQVANSIGNLLGDRDEFYPLLEADDMTRDAIILKALTTARRRMAAACGDNEEDREFVEVHIDAAILRYESGDFAGSIVCLRKSAGRALRAFAQGTRGRRWLAFHGIQADETWVGDTEWVGALLSTNDHLKRNVGFVQGLEREGRSREVCVEELLLAVFALQQISNEFVRMRRGGAQ